MRKFPEKLHLVRAICDHMFGEKHTPVHHMSVGAVVMLAGVTIAKIGSDIHFVVAHYGLDLIGYFVHGLGAVPFVEHLIATVNTETKDPAETLVVLDQDRLPEIDEEMLL